MSRTEFVRTHEMLSQLRRALAPLLVAATCGAAAVAGALV